MDGQDVQRWLVHLLGRYSPAYASNQYRALKRFFRWLAEEEDLSDPMTRLCPTKVTDKPVPGVHQRRTARALDRHLRVRARHAQAGRPRLWLGASNRGPMTANGIYQMIAHRGRR